MFTVLVKKDDNAFPFGLVTSRQRLNSLMKYESQIALASPFPLGSGVFSIESCRKGYELRVWSDIE